MKTMNVEEDKTEPARIFENLSDVYNNGDAEDFTKFQAGLLEKLNELSYVLKTLESGLLNRVNKLIEKTK